MLVCPLHEIQYWTKSTFKLIEGKLKKRNRSRSRCQSTWEIMGESTATNENTQTHPHTPSPHTHTPTHPHTHTPTHPHTHTPTHPHTHTPTHPHTHTPTHPHTHTPTHPHTHTPTHPHTHTPTHPHTQAEVDGRRRQFKCHSLRSAESKLNFQGGRTMRYCKQPPLSSRGRQNTQVDIVNVVLGACSGVHLVQVLAAHSDCQQSCSWASVPDLSFLRTNGDDGQD